MERITKGEIHPPWGEAWAPVRPRRMKSVDFNGVLGLERHLVADVPLVVRVNNQVFANHGFRLTDEEEYRRLFRFPVKDYYEKMGVSEADYYRIAGEWSQAYHQQFPGTPLSPHAAETVRRLHDAGLRMVILSASKETLLLDQLAQYPELDGCFDRVMGLTDIYAVSKVQRGVDFLREAGIPGDEAVFLGGYPPRCGGGPGHGLPMPFDRRRPSKGRNPSRFRGHGAAHPSGSGRLDHGEARP